MIFKVNMNKLNRKHLKLNKEIKAVTYKIWMFPLKTDSQ